MKRCGVLDGDLFLVGGCWSSFEDLYLVVVDRGKANCLVCVCCEGREKKGCNKTNSEKSRL